MYFEPKEKKIAAILLAAGESKRLGYSKQLIEYKGIPMINYMIDTIRLGEIEDIFVVLGSHQEEIKNSIKDASVKIVENSKWRDGIHSSVSEGVNSVERYYDAAMIFVVDQPYLFPEIIKKFVYLFHFSDAEIIACRVSGEQIHPVLFRKDMLKYLRNSKNQKTGKHLIQENPPLWLDFTDEKLLFDIDTKDDYQHFILQNHLD